MYTKPTRVKQQLKLGVGDPNGNVESDTYQLSYTI